MRRSVLRLSVAIVMLLGASAHTQVAPPQGAAAGPLAGRWELVVLPPPSESSGPRSIPFCIVEIGGTEASPTAKLIDTMGAPALTMTLDRLSTKGGQLSFALSMMGRTITFTGKRVGDHLEGTAAADTDPTPANWTAAPTTKDKLPSIAEIAAAAQAAQPPDQQAFAAAAGKPTAERVAALREFLAQFPDSPLRDQATLQIAQSYASAAERAAALNAFLKDFPASALREQAEYQLTRTYASASDRQAAEERFVKDHPRSAFASTIYSQWFDRLVSQKPADEAKLAAVIDGMMASSPAALRPSTMNTIADRLMANDLMLDRALDAIQQGIAAAGDKAPPASLGVYTTTLGQVLFKLKRYDEAGETLKKAIALSGGDGDAEAQLFLGKYYEIKADEAAALDAYLKAYQLGSPYDTKASLDRLYVKKYGSTAGLEDRLDAVYRAKPKGFDPGHYTRTPPASPGTADRVVLAELFTGAECAPCVAADLAFEGLGERYDPATIAVLVYHLHIPGPDPMTNPDAEARAKYYGVNGTPAVAIDGTGRSSGGGPASMAAALFKQYTSQIEARLGTAPLATLSGFSRQVDGQTITVKGTAALTAAGADRAGHATLHVALVEDSVRYVGSNGVRFHGFVVRKLFGSPAGDPLGADAPISVSGSTDAGTLKAGLDAYLSAYEEHTSTSARGPFTFKERVTGIDAGKLLVVAFVQDDQTKEILQATVVR